jgi:hypothetical protein
MIKTPTGEPLEPRFDWYQATAKIEVNDVLEVLEPITASGEMRQESPKLKGYNSCFKVGGPGGSLFIHYGGRNGDEHGPNVQGTGPLSPQVAELLRAACIPHSVGRADVCIDFLADFNVCHSVFVARCNEASMGSTDIGSSKDSIKQLGRTVYGGSPSSSYRPTCYEKGLQLGKDYPTNFVRLEHRFQFSKAHEKQQLSTLTPLQMCGLRPVARDLTLSLAELAVQAYHLVKLPKEKTPYFWMLKMYEATLREMKQDHGSWAAVGEQIGFDLDNMAEAQ